MFDHVVVLMLENNSFDRMLGFLPDADGVDPAVPRTNPDLGPNAPPVRQAPTTARNIAADPDHNLNDVLGQIADGMQGFVASFARTYPNSPPAERQEIMAYYAPGVLPALHTLAEQFVVCDSWFSSVPGPTWPNRFFAHSGTSLGHVDMPEGVFTPGLHAYDQTTICDLLHRAGKSFAVYYGDFPQSLVLLHQLDHLDAYKKMPEFYADVRAAESAFPAYVFIEPTYFGATPDDQHPPHDVLRGDALIASVYDALKSNPALFARTLFVILYDEHGGFFDHVEPPASVPPDSHTAIFAFNQYGVRVPAVLVSPLLDHAVLPETFDHTSLLRFLIDGWNVGGGAAAPLGARAAQAADFAPLLRLRTSPRSLPELPLAPAPRIAESVPALNAQQSALLGFSQYLESLIRDPALRAQLAARAHEAMGDPRTQGNLARDRLEAFLGERRGGA